MGISAIIRGYTSRRALTFSENHGYIYAIGELYYLYIFVILLLKIALALIKGYPNTMANTNISRNITRRSFGALALGSFGALALAACGASNSSSTSGASASTSSKPAPSALPDGMGTTVADGVFPRTVKHFKGETTIESEPKKIVVISTGQIDDVLALGVVPVGVADAKEADGVPSYLKTKYADKASELDAITKVGKRTAPSIEAITNLKPDLILINSTAKDEAIYESLGKVAPVVVTEGQGLNWKQDFLLIAHAMGAVEKAEQLLKDYETSAKKLGEMANAKGKTFSFLYASADRTRIFAKSSFTGSITTDAGLDRPASQQVAKTSVDISAEQLDQADGDYLFYAVQSGDESKLTGEALWPTLKAVTENHAYSVDADAFYMNAGITAAQVVVDKIAEVLK